MSCFPISDGRVWIKKLQPISQSRTIFGCTTDPLMWGFEFDRVLRCTHRCTQLSKFNYNQTMLVLVVGQSILTIYVTFIYLDYHTIYMCIYIYISLKIWTHVIWLDFHCNFLCECSPQLILIVNILLSISFMPF